MKHELFPSFPCRRWHVCFLLLITVLCSCHKLDLVEPDHCSYQGTTEFIDSSRASELSRIICQTLNEEKIPGIQVSIRDSSGQSWDLSSGFSDLEQNRLLQQTDLLRIGSVTKMYTATLILKLVEEGSLRLDQKLSTFFPEYPSVRNVAVRNLLNHSSGIVDIFSIPALFVSSSAFPDKFWDPHHLAEICLEKNLEFEPGTDQSYSNTNFILLGLIAEQVTGMKIHVLFREKLFAPLGLESTALVPYAPPPPNLINGYVRHYALSMSEWYTFKPEHTSWSTLAYSAGALVTNARELSRFVHLLFQNRILDQEILSSMLEFEGNRGLGISRISVNGRQMYGHEGEITGFESVAVYDPATGTTISICSNKTPFDIYSFLDQIEAHLE